MCVENWRPVVGHEGSYEVSDFGRVRSLTRYVVHPDGVSRLRMGKYLQPFVNHGRPAVDLCGKTWRIHILVAAAFLGPRPPGLHVCHNNGDPFDNTLGNLRYDTALENARDRVRHALGAGRTPGTRTLRDTCMKGHPYDEENTRVRPDGTRKCRTCHRDECRRQYAAKKAALAEAAS